MAFWDPFQNSRSGPAGGRDFSKWCSKSVKRSAPVRSGLTFEFYRVLEDSKTHETLLYKRFWSFSETFQGGPFGTLWDPWGGKLGKWKMEEILKNGALHCRFLMKI